MGAPFFNPVPANSGGFVTSFVVPNRMRLFNITAYNSNTAARYVLVFDATSQPANGTIPILVFPIAAQASLYPPVSFMDQGRLFTTGICVVLSTTDTTLTAASATMTVDVIAS
jgi:hypothetical protein